MSDYWKHFLIVTCFIVLCSPPAYASCDEYTQCELVYPSEDIQCNIDEQGNSAAPCYGVGSTVHSCICTGTGQTLQLPANGKDSFTCTQDAKWETGLSKLECIAKTCTKPVFDNVIVDPNRDSYDNGTEVVFTCKDGFIINGSVEALCLCGNWRMLQEEPGCYAKQCYRPPLGDDSLMLIPDQKSYINGSEVIFECQDCFDLNAEEISTTCLNGNWTSYTEPSCSIKTCAKPVFDNVIVNPNRDSYDNGTEVVFTCKDGFIINGSVEALCLCGNWRMLQEEPGCYAKQCYPPPLGDDSLMRIPDQKSYINGSEVIFECQECFDLNAEEISTTCLNGNWTSYTEPSCSIKTCTKPVFDNVIVNPNRDSYDNGTEVVFTCKDGFIINGSVEALCLCGNWRMLQEEPGCYAKQCYRPPLGDDSLMLIPDQKSYINGSEVIFECQECFDLNAEEISTTCLNGNWTSYTEPSCSIKTCTKPVFDNVIVDPNRDSYDNGTEVVFTCNDGFIITGSVEAICLCGNWSMLQAEPSCYESPFVSCPPENVSHSGVHLTFHPNLPETCANSTQTCGKDSAIKAEEPLATRECTENGWEEPVLTNCYTNEEAVNKIADIENTTVTEGNVEDVANALALATTYTDALTAKEIDSVARSLEAIVEINSSSAEVTESVVGTVNNLMQLKNEDLGQAESIASVISSLEQQVSNVQQSPDNFTNVENNVGVEAVKLDTVIANGVTFFIVPSTSSSDDVVINADFEKEDLQLYNSQEEVKLENSTSSIYIPKGVLERAIENTTSPNRSQVLVSYSIFKDYRLFQATQTSKSFGSPVALQTQNNNVQRQVIASQVIAAKVEGNVNIRNLQGEDLIIARFIINPVLQENETVHEKKCVYWKELETSNEGQWKDDGCTTTEDNNKTVCICNHLTNFAVLVGIGAKQKALDVITVIGSCLSIVGLSVCVLTIILIKELRQKQSAQIHLNLCVSLIAFYITFLSSDLAAKDERHCKNISSAIHYFCLVTVGWMSVEAVNMYVLFVKYKRDDLPFFLPISAALVYGLSLVPVTAVAVLEDPEKYTDADVCFLQEGQSLYFGFLLEILIMVVFNIFIFMLLLRNVVFRPMFSTTSKLDKKKEMFARMQLFVVFWMLLGLSWIFGFLAVIPDRKTIFLEIMFCILTAMQGFALFIFICLKNPEVKKRFRKATSTGKGSYKTTRGKMDREKSTKESYTAGSDALNKTRLRLSTVDENKSNQRSNTNNKQDIVVLSLTEQSPKR